MNIDNSTLLIAPSILAANWGSIAQEAKDATAGGADMLHLDVMDGHFVPEITFGPSVVEAIDTATDLPLDVHLMVEKPERQLERFAQAGADILTVHVEACPHIHHTIQLIHQLNCKAGVALNPGTPVSSIRSVVEQIDLVLIMTVNPGWGGQAFIPSSKQRIQEAAELIAATGKTIHLEVDGGISEKTASIVRQAGANVLVAGTSVFRQPDYAKAIQVLRDASQ